MSQSMAPEPRMLRGLQKQSWSIHEAISELIDNSLGKIRGDASIIEVFHSPRKRILSVLDNGQGMEEVSKLFRLADTIGKSAGDIGQHGSGGTMALLYLFHDVTVWTMREGRVSTYTVNWPDVFEMRDWPTIPETWQRATASNTPAQLYQIGHGTFIRGQMLPTRRVTASNVRRDLSAIYSPALREGRTITWQTDQQDPVSLAAPFPVFGSGKAVDIELVLVTPRDDLFVRGKIGLIQDLPLDKSVVHVCGPHRVISRTKDFYSDPNGPEVFRVSGIGGWLELLDWPLSLTKDKIDDEPAYHRLREEIFSKIRPLLLELHETKQSIVLEGIAMDLSVALDNGIETTVRVEPPEPVEPHDHESGGRGESTTPDVKNDSVVPPPAGDDGEERKQPAAMRLDIGQKSDSDMAQRLCFAEEQGGSISVYVNSDHLIMQRALNEPVNRDFLAATALREVAAVLTERRDLLKRAFRPRLVRAVDAVDEDMQAGLIHRMLLDRMVEVGR